jgi:hypothetical protein
MPPTNLLYLGVGLNLSVLYKDVLNDHVKAIELSKELFKKALPEMYKVNENYKEITNVLEMMKNN